MVAGAEVGLAADGYHSLEERSSDPAAEFECVLVHLRLLSVEKVLLAVVRDQLAVEEEAAEAPVACACMAEAQAVTDASTHWQHAQSICASFLRPTVVHAAV